MLQFCMKCKGAVSVFLTLILIPTFIFSGVLIDGSRILSAKNIVSGAGDLAMNAALSNYDAELNKTYGLLAMADTPQEVEAALQDFFKVSLNASGVSEEDFAKSLVYLELVGDSFQAAGPEGTQIYQTEVIKQEILEYMKYRAPVTFTDRAILSRLEDLKEAKKQKEAARAQTDYESSLDDLQDLFYKIKEGNDCNPEKGVKGTRGTDSLKESYQKVYPETLQKAMLEEARQSYEKITMQSVALWRMRNCQDKEDADVESLMKKMVELAGSCQLSDVDAGTAAALIQMVYVKNGMVGKNPDDVLEGIDKEQDPEKYAEMKSLIENYAEACETLEAGKKATEQQIDEAVTTVYRAIFTQHFEAQKAETACIEILYNIEDLEKELDEIKQKYEIWDNAVGALKDGDVKEGFQENKKEADRLFGPAEADRAKGNLAGLKAIVENDRTFYREVKEQLEKVTFTGQALYELDTKSKFFGETAAYGNGIKTTAQVEQAGIAFMERYFDGGGISLSVANQDVADNQFVIDLEEIYCKEETSDTARQKEEEDKRNAELNTQIQKLADLMLNTKVQDKKIEDAWKNDIPTGWLSAAAESAQENANVKVEGGLDSKDKRKQAASNGMENLDKNDEGLEQVSGLLDKLSAGAEQFVEPLILTEYVIGMFSCYTSDMENGAEIANPLSISRDDLSDNALYRAEVEYILWGSQNATANVGKTKALIFTINLIFNMTFAFTNSNIKGDALTIAGFFPVGPLGKTAIKCALQTMTALGETVKNMVDLMDGKRVSLVKDKNNWETWLLTQGGTKEENPAKGFSYEEYLWIFVCVNMFVPSQQTRLLARTADCIELNMTDRKSNADHSLHDMYTMLEVDAQVSIRTTFLPKLCGAGYNVKEVDDETFTIPYVGIQGY